MHSTLRTWYILFKYRSINKTEALPAKLWSSTIQYSTAGMYCTQKQNSHLYAVLTQSLYLLKGVAPVFFFYSM